MNHLSNKYGTPIAKRGVCYFPAAIMQLAERLGYTAIQAVVIGFALDFIGGNGNGPECVWITWEEVERLTGISHSCVMAAAKKAREAGHIIEVRDRRRSHEYDVRPLLDEMERLAKLDEADADTTQEVSAPAAPPVAEAVERREQDQLNDAIAAAVPASPSTGRVHETVTAAVRYHQVDGIDANALKDFARRPEPTMEELERRVVAAREHNAKQPIVDDLTPEMMAKAFRSPKRVA